MVSACSFRWAPFPDFPDLPIINDPSHICGEREGILNVSQTALDLQFDGLMIETHTNPDKAWSDAKQQITPARLSEIIEELKVRVPKLTKDSSKEKLEGLRSEINILDNSLIELLADRMKISSEIGQIKKNNNVAILQQGRWAEILDKMLKEGAEYGLSDNFIETIFKAIHQESINTQEEVVNG